MKGRPPEKGSAFSRSWKYIAFGLSITAILVLAKIVIETQPIGHEIEVGAYRFLQGQLSPFASEANLSVIVVNKSEIPLGSDQATPRDVMKKLVEAIAAFRPSAIALDLDFSPREDGWVTDKDPDFFDACLKVKQKGVPVFLGVHRMMEAPPDTWLGLEKYQSLAAAIGLPDDTTRIPRWVRAEGSSGRLQSMSSAMAQAHSKSLPSPPGFLVWAVELTSDNNPGVQQQIAGRFELANALVNYSKLEQMQHETVSCTREGIIAEPRERFMGKMVIVGNASQNKFTDPFVVSGRASPIAGVYVHGCAAYTLAVEPLYEFKRSVRFALDFALSGIIILGAAWLRLRQSGVDNDQSRGWQGKFVWAAVVLTIILGIILVRLLSIIWLDFVLVVFALILHPKVEHRLGHLIDKLRTKVSSSLKKQEAHS